MLKLGVDGMTGSELEVLVMVGMEYQITFEGKCFVLSLVSREKNILVNCIIGTVAGRRKWTH